MSKSCKFQITDDNHTPIESFEFHPDSEEAKLMRDKDDLWTQFIRVDGKLYEQLPDDGNSPEQVYVPVEVPDVEALDGRDCVVVRAKKA
jgi:hypothetical protein